MNCIFCKLIKEEGAKKLLYSDEDFFCVADIHPKAPFHALFITRNHFNDVFELYRSDKDLYTKFFLRSTEITIEYFNKKECRYMINTGKSAGQEVEHVHLHIMSWM